MKLDEKDDKILEMLKENGRAAVVDIAKELKLTEGAVRHRVNKLLENGIIKKFTIEFSQVGSTAIILVNSKKDNKAMLKEIIQKIDVDHAYELAGESDACVLISRHSIDEIDKTIDEIRSLDSVAGTKTIICLKRWK